MRRVLIGMSLVCSIAFTTAAAVPAQADTVELSRVGLPFLWPSSGLVEMAAAGPADVWVTGVQGAFCIPALATWGCSYESEGNPVARRWTGRRWQEYPLTGYAGNGMATTVAVAAPDDVWVTATRTNDDDYLAHFDGSKFTEVEPPVADARLYVQGGPGGTWLGTSSGGQGLYRRVGNTWEAAKPENITSVRGLVARTPTDVWAVGVRLENGAQRPAAARWDGRVWRPMDYPADGPVPTGVLPVSATEAWVSAAGSLHHWDGSTWSRAELPDTVQNMELAMGEAGTVWLGGNKTVIVDGSRKSKAVLMRRVGGVWENVTVPMPWGRSELQISAVATAPGTGALWLTANTELGPVVFTGG